MEVRIPEYVEAFIFDLGEVIVNLTPDRVLTGFSRHTKVEKDQIEKILTGHPVFFDYETGKISDEEFVDAVNQLLNMEVSVYDFEAIWNSMLGEIPLRKLQLLEHLSTTHKTLVLSNTNEMHERGFDEIVRAITGGRIMSEFVQHAYYSHKLGRRKPNVDAFEYLVDTHGLNPLTTVFFDDKKENVDTAIALGIKSVHLKNPNQLYEYFGLSID